MSGDITELTKRVMVEFTRESEYLRLEKISLRRSHSVENSFWLPHLLLATKQSQPDDLGRPNLSVWFLSAFQSPKVFYRVIGAYLQDITASQVM